MSGKVKDLTGQRFGHWTVISRGENSPSKQPRWLCRCDCGKEKLVIGATLRNNTSTNCGCMQNVTHGGKHTRLYRIWGGMKKRCYNPNADNYKHYGGRGITICDLWLHDFAAFQSWALSHGYNDTLSIDRIDNDRGYSPDNCRWVSITDQNRHRSCNNYFSINNQTKTLSEWCDFYRLSYITVWARLQRGWTIEEALEIVKRE